MLPKLFRWLPPVVVLVLVAVPALRADEPPGGEIRVLASIPPLALIARDLLGELGQVDTLVSGAASPHDYALKVSDMRRLNRADLVLWMGPGLERFLEKPLAGLESNRVLSLGGFHSEPISEHRHNGDMHQWLSPARASQMARDIARRLQQRFPEQRQNLEQNLKRQLGSYERLDRQLKQVLTPVKNIGFVVQHRGYDYFVEAYGLNQLGWLSRSPEQPPGVRHLYELENKLKGLPEGEKAQCLFIERSHPSESARNLAEQMGLRPQALDILGRSALGYAELMLSLADDLAMCLRAP